MLCVLSVNKKAVTYHKWCGNSVSGSRGALFYVPFYYLFKDLDNMC